MSKYTRVTLDEKSTLVLDQVVSKLPVCSVFHFFSLYHIQSSRLNQSILQDMPLVIRRHRASIRSTSSSRETFAERKRWNRHFCKCEELSRFRSNAREPCTVRARSSTRSPRDKCWHRYIAPRVMARLFSSSMCSKTNAAIGAPVRRILLCSSFLSIFFLSFFSFSLASAACSVRGGIFLPIPRDLR